MSDATNQEEARILIIEDSEATRRLLELCLDRHDYALTTCTNGPSGLEAALTGDHDLLLLDIALPGMDGWEVLRRLRADERRGDVAVIVLTAHHDTILTTDGLLLDSIQGFVPKPFDITDLERTVAEVLARPRKPKRQSPS